MNLTHISDSMAIQTGEFFSNKNSQFLFIIILISAGVFPFYIAKLFGIDGIGLLAILHVAIFSFLAILFSVRNRFLYITLLASILTWQALITMPISGALGVIGIKLFIATKEIFVFSAVAALFYKNWRKLSLHAIDYLAIVFVIVQIIYFLKSSAAFFPRIVSLREGMMIVLFYALGRLMCFSWNDIDRVLRSIIFVSFFVVIFSFIERFLFDTSDWVAIGAIDYVKEKYVHWNVKLVNGLPNQWYTFWNGELSRRMVGPIGYAIALSRFLSFPTLALLYVTNIIKSNKINFPVQYSMFVLFMIAIFISLGRGGMLIMCGGIFILFTMKYKKTAMLMLLLGIIVVIKLSLITFDKGNLLRHFTGLGHGIASLVVNPIGYGLGSSGQLAVVYSSEVDDKVSESYFGGLAYQMGFPGVISFYLFAIVTMLTLFKIYLKTNLIRNVCNHNKKALLSFSTVSGVFATSLLGDSAVSSVSAGLTIMFSGIIITAYMNSYNNDTQISIQNDST